MVFSLFLLEKSGKHYKTNGFLTFLNEKVRNQWFCNICERKHNKTNGFVTLSSENAIKPMVFFPKQLVCKGSS